MPAEGLIRRFHEAAGLDPETVADPDSLIGVFQAFRPDGRAIEGLLDELDVGIALEQRLGELYAAAGNDRRPQGGRDAFFLVRNPPPLSPELAERHATDWLRGLHDLAAVLGDAETAGALEATPKVRVLEGIAPKHPKADEEKSSLLLTLQGEASALVERIDAGPAAAALRPAFYFIARDTMLRDYLMWPMYAEATGLEDPYEPYFQLWRHGVKYRVFTDTQIDLYLPRQHG